VVVVRAAYKTAAELSAGTTHAENPVKKNLIYIATASQKHTIDKSCITFSNLLYYLVIESI